MISPLLANVYLHYVLDLWVQSWRRQRARGEVIIVRYADDFVLGFQHRDDAERFLAALRARLRIFKLEVHPEKTRLIEFGRFAIASRAKRGLGKPETFDFLGFTHLCGHTRKDGYFHVYRRPMRKRIKRGLSKIKRELRKRMHLPIQVQGLWLRQVVQGWLNYYAVPGTYQAINLFCKQVGKTWFRSLCRRSQKARRSAPRLWKKIDHWMPFPKILHPFPNVRFDGRPKAGAV